MKACVPCQQSQLHTQEWPHSMESVGTQWVFLPPAGQNPTCTNLLGSPLIWRANLLP